MEDETDVSRKRCATSDIEVEGGIKKHWCTEHDKKIDAHNKVTTSSVVYQN